MRRLCFIFVCFFSTIMFAGVVTEQDALKKAQQFMPGKSFQTTDKSNRALIRGRQTDTPAYYVFNATNNDGFVIVSGDDRTESILGYADNGFFDENEMPLNVKAWLEFYENSIRSLGNSKIASIPQRTPHAPIEPLIKTKWGQGKPYNLQCPMEGEKNCVTGCVATSLAQVMLYHRWPAGNSEQIPSYTTSTLGTLEALPTTAFKWDLMKNKYEFDAMGDSVDAVAELMRYCGQINEMNYRNNESSAYIHYDRLVTLFDYSNNMQNINRSSFTNKQWEDIIYNDLANNLPVLYEGRNNNGGHQFICDGFDGNGLFHINWGWGGSYDGYYVLSLANPYGEGIGGSIGSNGYSNSQRAVIGFKPSVHDEQIIPRMTSYEVNLNISDYSRSTPDLSFEGVSLTGWINPIYNVIPDEEQSVETGWGLYQNNILIECIGYKAQKIYLYNSGAYLINNNMTISFGANLENGRYQLCQLYRFPNETVWNLCDNQTNESLVIDIEDTKMFIRRIDSNNAQYTINEISYSEDPCIGHTLYVTLNLTNTGETTHDNIFLWTRLNGSDSWTLATSALASLDPGESGNTTLLFTPSEAGINDIKITTDQFGENIIGAYSLAISDIVETTINGVTYSCIVNAKKAMVISYDSQTLQKEVVIPSTITNDGMAYSVVSIMGDAFKRNTSIVQLTVSEGIKSIGASAFSGCYYLKKVDLPSSLETIENDAFWNCYQIDNIIIPEGVISIGTRSFRYCFGLRNISLPSTIKMIGEYAFGNCTNLNTINVGIINPFAINENVFGIIQLDSDYETTIPSYAALCVPEGTAYNYKKTAGWNTFTIIAEPIVITAKDYTIQYGEELPDFKYTSVGAELDGTPLITCEATNQSPVGTYSIVISKGSVNNYNDTYINGTLTITKAPLTIFANDCVIWQDDVIPKLSATYQGFKNGDDPTVLTILPTLTSEVTTTSEPGDYLITASDAEAHNYEISYQSGILTINERIPGDVTSNGVVDVQDATIAINYILGERLDKYVYYMADMNRDNEIDIFDITAIINVILAKNSLKASIRSSYNKYNECHSNYSSTIQSGLEDVYLRAGYNEVCLSIYNPERFTSFQMDVEVPDGAELKSVELTGNNDTHFIQSALIGDNLYRIVTLSMRSQSLEKDNNDELISFQLDNSLNNEVNIRNIMFVTSTGDAHYFNDSNVMTPTYINENPVEVESEVIIFDLSGKRIYKEIKDLYKGIYIINNEKIIIK